MKIFASKIKYSLLVMLVVSLIDIFHESILHELGLSDDWIEIVITTIISIIQFSMIFWIFYMSQKIIEHSNKKEKQYRQLIELSPEGIIIYANGKIEFSNDAGARILGLNHSSELVNHRWEDFIDHEYYEELKLIEKKLEAEPQQTINHTIKVNRIDGIPLDLEVISSNIEYNGKQARQLIYKDITDRKKQEDMMKEYAYKDILTGLLNRRSFMEELYKLIEKSQLNKSSFAVMFIDLDGFKLVNDTLGHEGGDDLLKEVSHYFTNSVRKTDIVARMAGDEFTILLPGVTKDDCKQIGNKIINSFDSSMVIDGKKVKVTPSIGIALFPTDGDSSDLIIKHADMAMYQAKHLGKNNYQFYQDGPR